MEINWFTVIAQILNFFLLVWLLKRFFYKPILKAIHERESKITAQLKDAEAKMDEAKKKQDEFVDKNQTFDQQKKELMDKAIAETKAERDKLMQQVRIDAGAMQAKLEKANNDTQADQHRALLQRAQQEVFAVSKKTLSDLASVSLEENAVRVFLKRLTDLNENEKMKFIEAFREAKPIQIQSAFDLPETQQKNIKDAVNKMMNADVQTHFSTSPELISGIELSANGYKIAWSISGYLHSIEHEILKSITQKQVAKSQKV
ncbi:F0F1 ATP synthase subunit delta [Algoriphagus persicinus]|uniref:F0F1 ATP synthase subunit delta n=1 Tax=Algoriphagus persicinus TaxID=3108754 RepID=UPI002B3EE5F0|nr:F0F1 ATP synthase subunit delta [Algoriphagus sp. E1-3-M2]MEB2787093.1 F0F1 ATP synthase subunit delta [Algoriphagus sp. E1-3-M2]